MVSAGQSEAATSAQQWLSCAIENLDTLFPQKWEALTIHGDLLLCVRPQEHKRQHLPGPLLAQQGGFSTGFSLRRELIDLS